MKFRFNVAAAVACAVADATEREANRIPLTPPRVLGLLQGLEGAPALEHIPRAWRANVLSDPAVLMRAAGVLTGG